MPSGKKPFRTSSRPFAPLSEEAKKRVLGAFRELRDVGDLDPVDEPLEKRKLRRRHQKKYGQR